MRKGIVVSLSLFIIATITVILMTCCTPPKFLRVPVTPEQIERITDNQEAIESWRTNLEGTDDIEATDECSSTNGLHWFAETFLQKNWWDCCIQHDWDYGWGYGFGVSRVTADYELWKCVNESGHHYVANIVYWAVRFGGSSHYNDGMCLNE